MCYLMCSFEHLYRTCDSVFKGGYPHMTNKRSDEGREK